MGLLGPSLPWGWEVRFLPCHGWKHACRHWWLHDRRLYCLRCWRDGVGVKMSHSWPLPSKILLIASSWDLSVAVSLIAFFPVWSLGKFVR